MAKEDENKDDNKPEDITIKVGEEDVVKTLDELKDIATKALSEDGKQTYTLTVDGEDKTYTIDELKEAAQKTKGADAKFEAAAEDRKKAERGVRIAELIDDIKKSENPSEEKITEFLKELGATPEEIQTQIGKAKPTGGTKKDSKAQPIKMEDLDPEIQAQLKESNKQNLTQIRNRIEDDCKKGVDGDQVLGKLIVGVQEGDQRDKVTKALHDMVVDDVRGRILAREPYGPEMVRSSLQKIRARVEVFGIPANAAGTGPVLPAELAAVAALNPEIQATEPIKRVASTDADYEDVFLKRMQQKMVKAAQNLGAGGRGRQML